MSNLIVSRLGGDAALNAEEIKKTAEIILSDPSRRYVIVSAPGAAPGSVGMTDLLYLCHSSFNGNENYISIIKKISDRYSEIVAGLGIDFNVEAEISALRKSLEAGKDLDYIGSRGEYIMSKIFAKYLNWDFVDSTEVIFFNDNGTVDKEKTFKTGGERLKNFEHAVIPSFYGSMPGGKIKTFSRGDCDSAGALVACSVKADLFEKWSETSRIYIADPSVVPEAELVRNITYSEAIELNYVGIKVVNDDVLLMLNEAGIPLDIASIHKPDDIIITISPELIPGIKRNLTACISGRRGFNVVHIHKYGLNKVHDFGEKLFGIFAKHHIACRHYLSGIHQMSVIIKTPIFDIRRNQILSEIQDEVQPDSLITEKGLSMVAVIGEGMGTVKGIFGKIFDAIANAGIKVQMIEQGADKLNIMIGVLDADYDNAIKALYNALIEK